MKEDVYSYDGRIVTTTITVIYTTNCCGEREKREERREKREKGAEFFSLSLLLSFSGRRTKGRNPPMAPKERTKDPRKKKFASHLSC